MAEHNKILAATAATIGALAVVVMPANSLAREKYTPNDYAWSYYTLKLTNVLKHDDKGRLVPVRDGQGNVVRDRHKYIVHETEQKLLPFSVHNNPEIHLNTEFTYLGETKLGDVITIPDNTVGDITIWSLQPDRNFTEARVAKPDSPVSINGDDVAAVITGDGNESHLQTLFVMNGDTACKITNVHLHNKGDQTSNFVIHNPTAYESSGRRYSILHIERACPKPPAPGG